MVYIRRKKERGNYYYYMEHSQRVDGKVKKHSKYIGKELPDPSELEMIRSEFFNKIYSEIWLQKLDLILENFHHEIKDIPKSALKKSMNDFSIRFTYNSNRIEGNTLKLRDTKLLLEDGLAPNKPINDIKETETHQKVFYDMIGYKGIITEDIILKWHFDLFKFTQTDIAGEYRRHNVAISGSEYAPPHHIELENLLTEFYAWLNNAVSNLVIHPVELGALAHIKFVSIHPFSDGNGRISRLLMNWILNKFNFPMLIIEYQNRYSYYSSLERSQIKDQPYVFVQYIFRVYMRTYKRYMKAIKTLK